MLTFDDAVNKILYLMKILNILVKFSYRCYSNDHLKSTDMFYYLYV